MNLAEILPLLVPLIVLQIVLMVVALRDLIQPDRHVRGGNKGIWALIIVLGELLGPIVYFVAGRDE